MLQGLPTVPRFIFWLVITGGAGFILMILLYSLNVISMQIMIWYHLTYMIGGLFSLITAALLFSRVKKA